MSGDVTSDWLERLPDGTVEFDVATGDVRRANRRFCELVDRDSESLVGAGIDHLGCEDADATVRERMAEADPGESIRFEWSVQRASGDCLPVEIGLTAPRAGDDRVVATVRDVSDRVARERRLEQYRRRLDGAMFAGDLAWWEMDVETGEVRFHEHKADLLGFSPEQFSHYEDFMELVHPDDAERAMQAMRDHFAGHAEKYDTEYRIRDADGEYRWFHDVGGVTEWTDGGDPAKATGVVVDVTARKQAESELQWKTEQLAMMNRLVRHDINNEMSIITGWLDLLREDVDPALHDRLDRVIEAGESVLELTRTIQTVTDLIVDDEATLALEPVDLQPVLDAEATAVRTSFDRATVDVDDVPDVAVLANSLLSSVFRNLLNNAVQHNDADEPRVSVSVEDRGDTVTIAVADNGPGIPDDRKDEVFSRGATTSEADDSGFGLYLVSRLVEGYGGSVRVTDNDPTGAVFRVDLQKAD
jgi:PAS domain S-box-containing protein